jgi:CBS domain-containing protein
MLVKEVMIKNVVTIEKDKTIFDACNIYRDYKIGCLIVTDNKKVVGIVTERDIIERTICTHLNPFNTKVSEIMSTDMKTIHPLDKIDDAIKIIFEHRVKKLPVMTKDEIVGIITVTDISRARPAISKRFMETWIKVDWRD